MLRRGRRSPCFSQSLGKRTRCYTTYSPRRIRKTSPLAEIVAKLKEHFKPEHLIIAQRFHFHRRNQGPDESIADYIAELRRLAACCKFDAYLDEALRDRLVCGLRNDAVTVSNITPHTQPPVLDATMRGNPSYRCGRVGHSPQTCSHKRSVCHSCHKRGHLSRVCKWFLSLQTMRTPSQCETVTSTD